MNFHLLLVGAISLFFSLPASVMAGVSIDGQEAPYSVWHKMVMPGQSITVTPESNESLFLDDQPIGGEWTAPQTAGVHLLTSQDQFGKISARVSLFVLEPASSINAKGYIGTYRIGTYPRDTPKGFIRLNKSEADTPLSPRFRVGQFLCKQQPNEWPKYLIVSEPNIKRLETLLSALNKDGITQANAITVMSGYRTPFYNTAIGSAKFSRHMYGDAADIYIDAAPPDGNMDDLNGDGIVNKADANFMYDYAQKLFSRVKVKSGGLGSYKANSVHGPFVHVDSRGHKARWGR